MTADHHCPPAETLCQLAFAQANEEKLSADLKAAKRHAGECTACWARLAQYTRLIGGLRRALPEEPPADSPCIDDNLLAEYLDDVQSMEERLAVEAHLAQCGACLRNLAELHDAVTHVAAPSAVQYIVALAKKGPRMLLHPEEGFAFLQFQPAAVLAPEDSDAVCSWSQEKGDLNVRFTLYQTDRTHASLTINAKLAEQPAEGVRVSLRKGESLIEAHTFSSTGVLTLDHLPENGYHLEFVLPSGERFDVALSLVQQETP